MRKIAKGLLVSAAICLLALTLVNAAPQGVGQAPGVTGGLPQGSYWQTGGITTSIASPSQNATKMWGFTPLVSFTATTIGYSILTADNTSNLYDLGIFDSNCNLLAHIGATAGTAFAPTTGAKSLTWTGSVTLNASAYQNYYIGWTTNCSSSCAALAGSSQSSFQVGGAGATTTGGVLTSGSCPSNAWQGGNFPGIILHN